MYVIFCTAVLGVVNNHMKSSARHLSRGASRAVARARGGNW
jgi:hypothetical protein